MNETRSTSCRKVFISLALATVVCGASSAGAQTETVTQGAEDSSSAGPSWLPYTRNGYLGISLGKPDYAEDCSFPFKCDDTDLAAKIVTGGMFNNNLGIELAYIDFGKQEINGGERKAHGINISMLGNFPVGRTNLFGKVGSTYGWTKTDVVLGASGDRSGWGLSYGAGVGYDVTRNTQLLIEWDKHRLDFAGSDNSKVDTYSIGVKYRY